MMKMSTKRTYNRYYAVLKSNAKQLIVDSYKDQMIKYQSLRNHLTNFTPKHASESFRSVLLSKLVITILYSYPCSLFFVYMILFYGDEVSYKNITYDDIICTKTVKSSNNQRCIYSSIELIILLCIVSCPSHVLFAFCVLIVNTFWIEISEVKHKLSEHILLLDCVNLNAIEINNTRDRRNLMNEIEKVKTVEFFLLKTMIWLNCVQTRFKHSISLINQIVISVTKYLLISGIIIFGYKRLGFITSSPLTYIVILGLLTNVFLYTFNFFNKACQDILCKDLLILTARLIKVNRDLTDLMTRYNIETNYLFVAKVKRSKEFICCYSEKNKNPGLIMNDDNHNPISTFYDFATMQDTIVNPFLLKVWRSRLHNLDLIKKKLSISIVGISIDERIITTVSKHNK